MPIPLAFIIMQMGWREARVAVAVVIIVLTLITAPLTCRRPEDYGLFPDGLTAHLEDEKAPPPAEVSLSRKEAMHTPSFWLLAAGTNLASLAIFGINLHMFS